MSPRDASSDLRAWNPRSPTERRLHASELGIELIIGRIEAKFKLSQPRPEADLTGVIDGARSPWRYRYRCSPIRAHNPCTMAILGSTGHRR